MHGLPRKTYDREKPTPRYARIRTQENMHRKKKRDMKILEPKRYEREEKYRKEMRQGRSISSQASPRL
jgi:hypothetical protein